MKSKLKKIFKSRIFIFVLGILISGSVSVFAVTYFPSNQVTYDNKTSGLNSTDVQGAIDELYNTCSSAVSSGNYIYYAVNGYYSGYEKPYKSNLYRCDVDGGSCKVIVSYNNNYGIGAVFANNDYVYYAINRFNSSGAAVLSNLLRCNTDGSYCNSIVSYSNGYSIDGIFVNNNYIYYSINNYYSDGTPSSGILLRCNTDGS